MFRERWMTVLAVAMVVSGCAAGGAQTAPFCGDGTIDEREECDDGNSEDGDGCSDECDVEWGWSCDEDTCESSCGDGVAVGDEVCDEGPDHPYCSADCMQQLASCGDGVVQWQVERCDEGAGPVRGCASDCLSKYGFTCDSGTNTCVATGLPGDETIASLTDEEIVQLCAWLTKVGGGPGSTQYCGDTAHTINTVEQCVEAVNGAPIAVTDCTILEIEDWVSAAGSPCNVLNKLDPSCAH